MEENYLFHYYEAENGPFRNLSALSNEDAQTVQDNLKLEGIVFASKRSDDYLLIRRQLEELARNIFISKGGKPRKSYPHYMTFGACDWLKEWYRDSKEIKIHIEEFDPRTISFTYGDLFPTMRYRDGKPYRERIYLKHEIIELVKEIGWPQIWNRNGNKGPERYIEVQVWDDKVINKYL
jgi:hypothetical protein